MTQYKPSPRPTYHEPTPLPYAGDRPPPVRETPKPARSPTGSMCPAPRSTRSSGGWRPAAPSATPPSSVTIFGADPIDHVLSGTMVIANPEHGEVQRVLPGEAAFFAVYLAPCLQLRDRPAAGAGIFCPAPFPGHLRSLRPYQTLARRLQLHQRPGPRTPGRWNALRSSRPRQSPSCATKILLWRFEGGQLLVGLLCSTEHLTSRQAAPAPRTPQRPSLPSRGQEPLPDPKAPSTSSAPTNPTRPTGSSCTNRTASFCPPAPATSSTISPASRSSVCLASRRPTAERCTRCLLLPSPAFQRSRQACWPRASLRRPRHRCRRHQSRRWPGRLTGHGPAAPQRTHRGRQSRRPRPGADTRRQPAPTAPARSTALWPTGLSLCEPRHPDGQIASDDTIACGAACPIQTLLAERTALAVVEADIRARARWRRPAHGACGGLATFCMSMSAPASAAAWC
jgi:hypothetical protein